AGRLDLALDMQSPLVLEPTEKGFGVDVARLLAVRIRSGVQENWRELRAVEEHIETITQEFDGEDVLHERVRTQFDEAKLILVALRERVQKYTGPFELSDPDEELRELVQRIVDHE